MDSVPFPGSSRKLCQANALSYQLASSIRQDVDCGAFVTYWFWDLGGLFAGWQILCDCGEILNGRVPLWLWRILRLEIFQMKDLRLYQSEIGSFATCAEWWIFDMISETSGFVIILTTSYNLLCCWFDKWFLAQPQWPASKSANILWASLRIAAELLQKFHEDHKLGRVVP